MGEFALLGEMQAQEHAGNIAEAHYQRLDNLDALVAYLQARMLADRR